MRAKLHTPAAPPAIRHLVMRVGVVLIIILVTVLLMYFEGGLVDSKTGAKPTFLDTLYFTMVTITTVGYGDIVPVSSFARLTDTFFLTPMRFIIFVLFVGMAYELTFKRFQESFRMNRAVQRLKNHVVVCGFGETGQVAVQELIASGRPPDQIVVLETDEAALDQATKLDVVAMLGDATKAREALDWHPKITFDGLVKNMVLQDLDILQKSNRISICFPLTSAFPSLLQEICHESRILRVSSRD